MDEPTIPPCPASSSLHDSSLPSAAPACTARSARSGTSQSTATSRSWSPDRLRSAPEPLGTNGPGTPRARAGWCRDPPTASTQPNQDVSRFGRAAGPATAAGTLVDRGEHAPRRPRRARRRRDHRLLCAVRDRVRGGPGGARAGAAMDRRSRGSVGARRDARTAECAAPLTGRSADAAGAGERVGDRHGRARGGGARAAGDARAGLASDRDRHPDRLRFIGVQAAAPPAATDEVFRIVHTGSMHTDFGHDLRRTRARRRILGGQSARAGRPHSLARVPRRSDRAAAPRGAVARRPHRAPAGRRPDSR